MRSVSEGSGEREKRGSPGPQFMWKPLIVLTLVRSIVIDVLLVVSGCQVVCGERASQQRFAPALYADQTHSVCAVNGGKRILARDDRVVLEPEASVVREDGLALSDVALDERARGSASRDREGLAGRQSAAERENQHCSQLKDY